MRKYILSLRTSTYLVQGRLRWCRAPLLWHGRGDGRDHNRIGVAVEWRQGDNEGILDRRGGPDFLQRALRDRLVDIGHHHRFPARRVTADLHAGNVDAVLAQDRPEGPDHARLVVVVGNQHLSRERALQREAIDRDDPGVTRSQVTVTVWLGVPATSNTNCGSVCSSPSISGVLDLHPNVDRHHARVDWRDPAPEPLLERRAQRGTQHVLGDIRRDLTVHRKADPMRHIGHQHREQVPGGPGHRRQPPQAPVHPGWPAAG